MLCTVLAAGLQPILIPNVNLKNDKVLESELELVKSETPQNQRAGTQMWDPNLSIVLSFSLKIAKYKIQFGGSNPTSELHVRCCSCGGLKYSAAAAFRVVPYSEFKCTRINTTVIQRARRSPRPGLHLSLNHSSHSASWDFSSTSTRYLLLKNSNQNPPDILHIMPTCHLICLELADPFLTSVKTVRSPVSM